MNNMTRLPEENIPENYVAGIIGAVVCGLLGAVLYVLLAALGFIAGISGFVAFIAAYFGYKKLAGVEKSVTGIVVSVIVTLLMLAIGEYLSLGWAIYDAAKDAGASLSLMDAIGEVPEHLSYSDVKSAVIKDLAIGLFLTALATVSQVKSAFGEAKKSK